MTIHLSKEQERFVREAVRDGRFASAEQVVQAALERLRSAESEREAPPASRDPKADFHRSLLRFGLMTRLPEPASAPDDDPDDAPIEIEGEPLSATVTRERR